jgi:hypothetical protein
VDPASAGTLKIAGRKMIIMAMMTFIRGHIMFVESFDRQWNIADTYYGLIS